MGISFSADNQDYETQYTLGHSIEDDEELSDYIDRTYEVGVMYYQGCGTAETEIDIDEYNSINSEKEVNCNSSDEQELEKCYLTGIEQCLKDSIANGYPLNYVTLQLEDDSNGETVIISDNENNLWRCTSNTDCDTTSDMMRDGNDLKDTGMYYIDTGIDHGGSVGNWSPSKVSFNTKNIVNDDYTINTGEYGFYETDKELTDLKSHQYDEYGEEHDYYGSASEVPDIHYQWSLKDGENNNRYEISHGWYKSNIIDDTEQSSDNYSNFTIYIDNETSEDIEFNKIYIYSSQYNIEELIENGVISLTSNNDIDYDNDSNNYDYQLIDGINFLQGTIENNSIILDSNDDMKLLELNIDIDKYNINKYETNIYIILYLETDNSLEEIQNYMIKLYDCNGDEFITNSNYYKIDDCGVCLDPTDSNWNSTCAGCDGEPNSGKEFDECDDCLDPDDSNWNESCKGCDGVVNSNLDFDDCGVCDGDDDCVINKTELVPKYGDELNNTTLHINYDNIDSMNKYFYNISESDTKSNIINGDYIPDEVFDNIDELINI